MRFAKVDNNNLSMELGKKIRVSYQLNICGKEDYKKEDYKKEGYIEYIGKSEFGDITNIKYLIMVKKI